MNQSNDREDSKAGDQRRWELYTEHVKQAWQDIQSSTDSFDRSLLTLSSGALALSLAFVKDIVPLKQAIWLRLLYTSWISFALSIVVTVFSFRLSIAAQNANLEYLRKFYIERDQKYFNKKSTPSKALAVFTWVAAGAFVVGMACTVIFCWANVARIPK